LRETYPDVGGGGYGDALERCAAVDRGGNSCDKPARIRIDVEAERVGGMDGTARIEVDVVEVKQVFDA
jgi:hypothetical protein